MEVKIKSNNEMIDATIEMVDGVMVVSPKEVKQDVSQFNTGDILVCGWKTSEKACEWICILDGRVEEQSHIQFFLEDFCGMYTKGYNGDKEIWLDHSFSDSATYIRYATEAEKKLLFDRLAKEGYEWDSTKKELVELKWKPRLSDILYIPKFIPLEEDGHGFYFKTLQQFYVPKLDVFLDKGMCFKTIEECDTFCQKLNEAINQVKP